jgi:hypothetical protein
MKLIKFSNQEVEEQDCIDFSLTLAITEFDTDYPVVYLRNMSQDFKAVGAYDNPELLGDYKTMYSPDFNTFWVKNDQGDYVFREYFDNIKIVKEIISEIKCLVEDPKFNSFDDFKICDLFRLLSALENFWN